MTQHTPGPHKVNLWTADLGSNADVRKAEEMADECGCYTLTLNKKTGAEIRYCPTHAAAPEMLALIRTIETVASTDMNAADKADLRKRARALLARVDGKS